MNIAQSFGGGCYDLMRRQIACSVWLCSGIAALMTLLSLFLLKPLLALMQTPTDLLKGSMLYGGIVLGGLPVMAAHQLLAGILRAMGDSRTPLQAIAVSSAVNILLDCLLVFVLHTGVEGVALATVISQGISALICGCRLQRNAQIRLGCGDFSADAAIGRELLRNGIPAACMNCVTAVGCMAVQGYINAMGTVFTSAYSVCSRYLDLAMLPALTAGFALSTFVGQNKGAGNRQRIREGVRTGAALAFISWVVMGGLMYWMPSWLAGLMINDARTISLAAEFLQICGAALLLLNLLFVFRGALQGMGRPLVPMCSGFLEMAIRIFTVMLLLENTGFLAAAYAQCMAWLGALAANAAVYTSMISGVRNRKKSPIPGIRLFQRGRYESKGIEDSRKEKEHGGNRL